MTLNNQANARHGQTPPDRLAGDRILTALLVLVCGMFVVFLLYPELSGRVFTVGDLLFQNFPFRHFYAVCLHNGDSFLWSPTFYSGFYLYGEGQTGMLHPWHLLLYRFIPLVPALGIELVTSYMFMAAGCYLFFRKWALSPSASLLGAFLFTFGGTNLAHLQHINLVAVTAHLPWMLLAMESCVTARTRRSIVLGSSGFALLVASQALIGHPHAMYLNAVIAWLDLAFLLTDPGKVRLRGVLALFGGGLLGLVMGAVQLLPTFNVARDSTRATKTLAFLSAVSLRPQELLQWINPLLFQAGCYDPVWGAHEVGIYCGGSVVLLLFASVVLRRHSETRRLQAFLAVLAVTGVVLALGEYNGVFTFYAKWSVIGLFRVPARYILLTHFALSAGAAVALNDLRMPQRISGAVRMIAVLLGSMSLIFAVLVVASQLPSTMKWPRAVPVLGDLSTHFASSRLVLAGAFMSVAGVILFLASHRWPAVARLLLALFVIIDVVAIQGRILAGLSTGDPFQISAGLLPPVPAPGPVQAPPANDLMSLAGYQLVNGYSAFDPRSPISMNSRLYAWIMGAKAYWNDGWQLTPSPLSLLRIRNQAIVAREPRNILQAVDFSRFAVVEAPIRLDSQATGELQWIENRPGRLMLSSQATGTVLATIGVRFDRGWNMMLDGQPQSTLLVDGCLLGFTIPAGRHDIQLRFVPADFYLGGRLSLAGLILLALYLILGLSPWP
jgi:hypothetical protein